MTDSERVIKGMRACRLYKCIECPYNGLHVGDKDCVQLLATEAAELLREKALERYVLKRMKTCSKQHDDCLDCEYEMPSVSCLLQAFAIALEVLENAG